MLISYPFLKSASTQDNTDSIRHAFSGQYPVTSYLEWHNGQHLIAPLEDGTYVPVRAIADGTVIHAVAAEAAPSNDKKHPQNYSAFGEGPDWTDKGFVIIKHTTEIGADGDTPTMLTFYSVYAHMKELAAGIAKDKKVYRKDVLGKPGSIYNRAGHIHFEICLDDTNIKKLLGQDPAEWPDQEATPTKDGRTDAVFGSTYVYLPASTPVQTTAPTSHVRGTATQTLGTAQWVQISYLNNTAAGSATLTSYKTDGSVVGAPRTDADAEYDLYKEANTRHSSLGTADKALSSPSGWYELLRFGRNLGRSATDKDPLPTNAAHWRKIMTPRGELWADLNAPGTFKFSDADFPAIMGWNCFGDDESKDDQRCDSAKLKRLLISDVKGMEERAEALKDPLFLFSQTRNDGIAAKLHKAICKFPSEFDQETIDARYGHIKEEEYFKSDASGNNWKALREHIMALTMKDLPGEYKQAQWHVHPLAFVEQMRKCGWLNAFELAQCFPRKLSHIHDTSFVASEWPWASALQRARVWSKTFSLMNRKYAIDYPRSRLVHYLSHVVPETGNLSLVKEGDNATGTYLSSKPYYPYYGRGLIQLTWQESYKKYGHYKCFSNTEQSGTFVAIGWNPDTVIAKSNAEYNASNCADSAGYYIASHESMLKKMDRGTEQEDAISVSKCVNGNVAIQNLNGLDVRLQSMIFEKSILLDGVDKEATVELSFSWRRNSNQEIVGYNAQGHPIKRYVLKESPWSIPVSLKKQRP